jgi:hypothetical protein
MEINTEHDQKEINHPELEAILEGKSTSNQAGLGEETANTTSKRKTPPPQKANKSDTVKMETNTEHPLPVHLYQGAARRVLYVGSCTRSTVGEHLRSGNLINTKKARQQEMPPAPTGG